MYTTDEFLDKNRDNLPADLILLLKRSSFQFLANLFLNSDHHELHIQTEQQQTAKGSSIKKKPTVSSIFKVILLKCNYLPFHSNSK